MENTHHQEVRGSSSRHAGHAAQLALVALDEQRVRHARGEAIAHQRDGLEGAVVPQLLARQRGLHIDAYLMS